MPVCKKPRAVVVGHDHQNTLGVIRSLGEAGFSVIAVLCSDFSSCYCAHSKYISEYHITSPGGLIKVLIELHASLDEQRLPLIPCGDDIVQALDQSSAVLSPIYYFPTTNYNNTCSISNLMKKTEMLKAAQSAGLNVPKWIEIKNEHFDCASELCKELCFPCIFKPIVLKPGGSFQYIILHTIQELAECIDFAKKNCETAVIQEYIQKTVEYGITGCRLHRQGSCVFGGIIKKKRFSRSSMGSTTAGWIIPGEHGIYRHIESFLASIDFRGLFDIEFIFNGTNMYFVEINFRNGGYGYAYTKAGKNFPAIWALEAMGEDCSRLINQECKKTFFINESADLQNVKAKSLSIFLWLRDVLFADAHMYINKRDMLPIFNKFKG